MIIDIDRLSGRLYIDPTVCLTEFPENFVFSLTYMQSTYLNIFFTTIFAFTNEHSRSIQVDTGWDCFLRRRVERTEKSAILKSP